MIIAIDGTSSSGKSSIARALGKKLNITTLGTGSIYRAIALKMLNLNISENDDIRIKEMLETTNIESFNYNGETTIKVDGLTQPKDVLSSHEVSVFTPLISCKDYVREYVRSYQRKLAEENKDIIIEGRDIGSVVFPSADYKFFIDADIKARASRRLNDYVNQGKIYTLKDVIEEIQERDNKDRQRHISPLIMTSDSILIDTSDISINQSVDKIISYINER